MAKYIYICSAGHSGSTLLDLLLGSHSKVASLGEIDQLSKNIALNTQCACGEPVRSCSLWREVLAAAGKRQGVNLLLQPYALHMGYPKASSVIDHAHQTRAYLLKRRVVLGLYYLYARFGLRTLAPFIRPVQQAVANNVMIFELVREHLGVDMVVDSSKSYLKAVALYRHDPANVRIVLLTRDGRGVYWSNVKRGVPGKDVVTAWRNQYARALPLLQQHVRREHLMRIKYEDIVLGPDEALGRLCAFLELGFEPSMQEFQHKVHHVTNGNDMRLQRSAALRLDTEWQTCLTADDLAVFERLAGSLNRELGYQ